MLENCLLEVEGDLGGGQGAARSEAVLRGFRKLEGLMSVLRMYPECEPAGSSLATPLAPLSCLPHPDAGCPFHCWLLLGH